MRLPLDRKRDGSCIEDRHIRRIVGRDRYQTASDDQPRHTSSTISSKMNLFIAKIGLRMFDKGSTEFDINSLEKILTCDENTAYVHLRNT